MSTLAIYPAVGISVPDENGVAIPSSGLTVTLSDYYRGLLASGLILTFDPLGANAPTDAELSSGYLREVLVTDLLNREGSYDGAIVVASGHTAALDGGGGMFVWEAGSATTADNGLVVGATAAGRWKRIYTGPVHMAWFGPTVTAAMVNTVINALTASGGGTVIMPERAYTITGVGSDRILLKSNVRLVFEPGCTIATGTATAAGFVMGAASNNSTIANIQIEGNGLVITGDPTETYLVNGLSFGGDGSSGGVDNVVVRNVEVRSFSNYGINIGGNAGTSTTRVMVQNFVADDCSHNGGAVTGDCSGIDFVDCEFLNSNGANQVTAGFDIEMNERTTSTANAAYDVRFTRCKFNGNQRNGFYSQGNDISSRVQVIDCEALNNGQIGFVLGTAGTIARGLRARGNTTVGIYVSADATVSDCITESNGTVGFQVVGTRTGGSANGIIARYNGTNGVVLGGFLGATPNFTLTNVTALCNKAKGIYLASAYGFQLNNCVAVGNWDDGISTLSSTQNTINNCYAAGNSSQTDNGVSGADNILVGGNSDLNSLTCNTTRRSQIYHRGVAVVGANTTLTTVELSAWALPDDDIYNGCRVRIIAGTENGAVGWVTDYVGSTRVISVTWDSALGGAPDGTSVIELCKTVVYTDTVQPGAGNTTTTTLLSQGIAPSIDDVFNNYYIHVTAGTGVAQLPKLISDYDGSDVTVTHAALSSALDYTSKVSIFSIARPRYGIRVSSGCHLNRVELNDCWYGGANTGYSDAGTSTYATASNRTT